MFIEILPYKKKSIDNKKDILRISFMKINKNENKIVLKLYIGQNIAKEINITEKDKISFFYEKENNKTFFIKKSQNSIGYTLLKMNDCFRTQLMWNTDILNPLSILGIRQVEFNRFEDGIRFYVK